MAQSKAEATGSKNPGPQMKVEFFRDEAGAHRWRLLSRNGRIIATSGEGYRRRSDAVNGFDGVAVGASTAHRVDTPAATAVKGPTTPAKAPEKSAKGRSGRKPATAATATQGAAKAPGKRGPGRPPRSSA